jgi:hypothetical protein
MTRRFKWFLALLLVAGVVIIAQASLESSVYFPVIYRQEPTETPTPTITSTPTITLTPTVTNTGTITIVFTPTPSGTISPTITPTRTLTPTPTPTLVPGVFIISIVFDPPGDPLDEYVYLRNQANNYVDMKGWTLRDENNNVYTFPRYTLTNYAYVKVWTKAGQNDPDNLYWGLSQPVWNDYGDCAYLRKPDSELSDSLCYGSAGQLYRP